MDIEGGTGDKYPVFIKELRKLMDNDPKINYLISGAPQCPYPDHYLGPERPGSGNRAVFLFVFWKHKTENTQLLWPWQQPDAIIKIWKTIALTHCDRCSHFTVVVRELLMRSIWRKFSSSFRFIPEFISVNYIYEMMKIWISCNFSSLSSYIKFIIIPRYITNQFNDHLTVVLPTQLVRAPHRSVIGIAEIKVSGIESRQNWSFSRFFLTMKIFYAFNYINITPFSTIPFRSINFFLKALDSTLKFLVVYFITRLSQLSFSGLEDAGQLVDHLYMQFYNNYCHTGAGKWLINTLNQWLAFSKRMKPKGPLIFIGLPQATRASSGAQYNRPPA